MAKENVLRHREARQSSQLLNDDGNAFVIGLDLVLRMNFLAVENEMPAVNGVNACQHIGQSGFARTVFSDQRMHFAFVDVK